MVQVVEGLLPSGRCRTQGGREGLQERVGSHEPSDGVGRRRQVPASRTLSYALTPPTTNRDGVFFFRADFFRLLCRFVTRLKEPNFAPKQSASSSSSRNKPSGSTPSSTKSAAPGPVATEISFRSIVEDMCSGANLLFLSTGRTTARGRNLYRVSKNVDGKGGVLCYLEDDVVWLVVGKAGGEGDAEPVGIEDMIRRAKGTAK